VVVNSATILEREVRWLGGRSKLRAGAVVLEIENGRWGGKRKGESTFVAAP